MKSGRVEFEKRIRASKNNRKEYFSTKKQFNLEILAILRLFMNYWGWLTPKCYILSST